MHFIAWLDFVDQWSIYNLLLRTISINELKKDVVTFKNIKAATEEQRNKETNRYYKLESTKEDDT